VDSWGWTCEEDGNWTTARKNVCWILFIERNKRSETSALKWHSVRWPGLFGPRKAVGAHQEAWKEYVKLFSFQETCLWSLRLRSKKWIHLGDKIDDFFMILLLFGSHAVLTFDLYNNSVRTAVSWILYQLSDWSLFGDCDVEERSVSNSLFVLPIGLLGRKMVRSLSCMEY
jgi:hypothetical protein